MFNTTFLADSTGTRTVCIGTASGTGAAAAAGTVAVLPALGPAGLFCDVDAHPVTSSRLATQAKEEFFIGDSANVVLRSGGV